MMDNNLISEEEKRKEKGKMNRLMDSKFWLRTIHELRWILLGLFCWHQSSWCVYRRTRNIKWNGKTSMEIH